MDEVAVPSALKQGAKASRGKGRYKPKGRMVDTAALGEVKALLGATPPQLDDDVRLGCCGDLLCFLKFICHGALSLMHYFL